MTLGEKQRLFVRLLADLIVFAYSHGYELTFGEAYRSNEQAEINALGDAGRVRLCQLLKSSQEFNLLAANIGDNVGSGIRTSVHMQRLAVDFNLFKDGKWLQGLEDWRPLGEYWESLNPLCKWGGRFKDSDHFSFEHEGRM